MPTCLTLCLHELFLVWKYLALALIVSTVQECLNGVQHAVAASLHNADLFGEQQGGGHMGRGWAGGGGGAECACCSVRVPEGHLDGLALADLS